MAGTIQQHQQQLGVVYAVTCYRHTGINLRSSWDTICCCSKQHQCISSDNNSRVSLESRVSCCDCRVSTVVSAGS